MDFKKLLPHVIVIAVFAAITMLYFSPLLKGKAIKQGDIVSHKGMSKEIADYREKVGEEPLWTNSMFGGMPAYQISTLYFGNLVRHLDKVLTLGLPHPAKLVFMYMLGFYILMLVLKIDPWLGFLGSVAFAFSSYFFIIIEAGHNSKAHAIGFMAPALAGVILAMRKKYLLGAALTAVFLTLQIYANHLQITYYLAILVFAYVAAESFKSIKEKDYKHLGIAAASLLVALVLAIGSNAGNLLVTSSYVEHTIRGETELSIDKSKKGTGLDKDYATAWSYGTGETMTLLVPKFKGGASGYINMEKGALDKVDPNFKQYIGQSDRYWGDQPFTSGPVYIGALVFALALMGLMIVRTRFKWVLLAVTILSIALAWGKNMMWLTDIFLDYVPGYNKFRTVSMILVLAELTLPILAVLALDKYIFNKDSLKEQVKLPLAKKEVSTYKLALAGLLIPAGLCVVYFLAPGALNTFYKTNEYNEIYSQVIKSANDDTARSFLANLEIARIAIFKPDVIRTLIFLLLGAGLLWYYKKGSLDKRLVLGTLSVFVLADMWNVNKRYLDDKSFVSPQEVKSPFPLTAASKFILQDKAPDYRVLNISVNTFNDASTSYYHKSVGGYHAAKLGRYQELIERQITPSMQNIISTLKADPTDSSITATLASQGVLNMLNTKYIIYNPEAEPLRNEFITGAAWFVNDAKVVANADSEIVAVGKINPKYVAVVDKRFESQLAGVSGGSESDRIVQESYEPNHLVYKSRSGADRLAVFSEIYYNGGWNAYVDGQPVEHMRVNYVLRGMKVPAGEHTIEFKFEPDVYQKGETISYASSSIVLLLLIASLATEFRKVKA